VSLLLGAGDAVDDPDQVKQLVYEVMFEFLTGWLDSPPPCESNEWSGNRVIVLGRR
jgi:hypothetical protein